MKKSCSKCGKIHDTNYICRAGLNTTANKYDYKEAKLRNTHSWHKKSAHIRADSQYLCAVCLDKGIYNYNNLEVHHITKLKENADGLLDDYNLVCLCSKCHKLADSGMIDKDYLISLAQKRTDEL